VSGPTSPHAAGGGNPAVCTSCPCEGTCPNDFLVDAPCRIIKAGGGRVQISAYELFGYPDGTYAWTTTSTKIRLSGANTSTVTVEALANPSDFLDAETITVTRTASGCSPVAKTVNVTVAKVTFSESRNQRYGYDDFDTPANPLDDHICVKSADNTFVKVDIEGGALSTDFNFVCDCSDIVPVSPPASASFDLRLNANISTFKINTTLHARCTCPEATSFASIAVHVYKEKRVDVVVAKIHDSTSAGTSLHYTALNASTHTAAVNAKLKEAVVRFDISNFDAANAVTDVAYDLDHNGALSYDINAGGGAEVQAINRAMTGTGTKTRVAIVRKLKSYYYLSQAVVIGATTLQVRGGNVFDYSSFPNVPLGTGADQEPVTVSSVSGSTITLASGVTKPHGIGAPIEFIAAGWSSDPIIIVEENAADGSLITQNDILWTIPHEVGHRDLGPPGDGLVDVNDQTNNMHHQQGGTDYRLRYCPRTKTYNPGTENQWDKIPR
jgi:hypothetical protein